MKKRIISIFLIVSIIVSVCAVSAVSTSAYSNMVSAPKNAKVVTDGYCFNVSWSHNNYATLYYHVWLHKWGTKSSKWIRYTSFGKSINIGSLENGATYDIKVSAHDKVGNESQYSNVCKRTFLIYPKLYQPETEDATFFTKYIDLVWSRVPKADYYVVWGQYKLTNGNDKWSSWQSKKIYSTNQYKWEVRKGYTFHIKVSAVKNGCHSDYSSMWKITAKFLD